MKVRRLDNNQDMTFGNGGLNFIEDSAAAVKQNLYTRLKLWLGEWFLNTTDGTDWLGKCIGKSTLETASEEIRRVILATPGVTAISSLTISDDKSTRVITVTADVLTKYGETSVNLRTGAGFIIN